MQTSMPAAQSGAQSSFPRDATHGEGLGSFLNIVFLVYQDNFGFILDL